MSVDFEKVNLDRDRKLRFLLLDTLKHALGHSPSGGLSGPTLIMMATALCDGAGVYFTDDSHALQLIQELRVRGYVEVQHKQRRQGEAFKAIHLVSVKITATGLELLSWDRDLDPMVDDGRRLD